MTTQDEFRLLGLSEQMLEAVKVKGFEVPTPVQKLTIPRLLSGEGDLIAQSQTGTGKTAAYGLPLLQELEPAAGHVQAIVLVPTRELALQVTEELLSFNNMRRLSIASIYGGASMSEQLRRLSRGIDIVVGTPGRVLDHIRRGTLDLSSVRFLILDEADEMLNMGFIEDVEEIMKHTPSHRRVLLFSATMPERIVRLSQNYMKDAEVVRVESKQLTADLTDQIYFEVRESDKFDALTRIIDVTPEFYGIVFSRTKVGVDELVNKLIEHGYSAEALHGDVSQAQREKILRKFKKKQANILVATDVAARGIDINNLTHVINYSLPQDSESYVHRIGRTGRAGNQGTAITFISSSELRRFGFLKRDLNADIKKETLPSPQDVVAMKRQRIMDELQEIVDGENWADYGDMADGILTLYPPEVALSALLRLAFRSELDQSNYPEIRSFSVDRKGTARLFIAVGRRDGYDVRKLVALLKRECGLKDNKITDIKLMDDFSFVSVPFSDGEHVIRKLNQIRKGDRPLAKIAKPKEGAGDYMADNIDADKKQRRQPVRKDKPAPQRKAIEREDAAAARAENYSDDAKNSYEKLPKKEKPRPAGDVSRTKHKAAEPSERVKEAKPRKEAKPVKKSPVPTETFDYTPSEENNRGFDWSVFESQGNKWERSERSAAKGKKKNVKK